MARTSNKAVRILRRSHWSLAQPLATARKLSKGHPFRKSMAKKLRKYRSKYDK